jgi:hypothetical protein
MKTYDVTIRAIITKTYIMEAESSDKAAEQANELFTPELDPCEYYEQETLSIEETSATDESRSNGPHQ